MRLISIIPFFLLSLFSYCQAPAIQWTRSFGGNDFDGDIGNSGYFEVCQTLDRGSIVAAGTYSTNGYASNNHGDEDILIIKLDRKGKTQWSKCLGGSKKEQPGSIKQTFDGGYIIAGETGSDDGDISGGHGQDDVWVIKLDANGNILWQKCFGGSSFDRTNDIQQTKDSGYIIAATSQSNDGDVIGNWHGFADYWIVKLDKHGMIEWQKTYGGSSNEEPSSIQQTSDGGYITCGYTFSTDGDVTGHHGSGIDGWILKLDSLGNLEWEKCVGGSLRDEAWSLKQSRDSGYIIAMLTASNNGDVSGNHGAQDYLLVKLNKHGDISWTKCLGGSGAELIHDIQVLNDDFLIAGCSNSIDGDVSGNHERTDYWIVRTDSLGNIIWQTSLGGKDDEDAFSVSYKKNSGYLIGGQTNSTDIINGFGDYDIWILKLFDDNVLPVTLLNFTAQKQTSAILLKWQTTNEANNSYFNIERSDDSKAFSAIGKVDGLNGINTNNYSFTDNAPLQGTNYYRLTQVDNDGKCVYSDVVSVQFGSNTSEFAISPNPASDNININIPASNVDSKIIFYDANGHKAIDEKVPAGVSFKQIGVSKLSTGNYTVVLIQGNVRKTKKFMKLNQ